MSLESSTLALRDKLGDGGGSAGLDATIKFVLGEGQIIFLDGASVPARVSNEDREATCTVRISPGDFDSLVARRLDPTVAFAMGKLKVSGDIAVALKLRKLLA